MFPCFTAGLTVKEQETTKTAIFRQIARTDVVALGVPHAANNRRLCEMGQCCSEGGGFAARSAAASSIAFIAGPSIA
jgi:hypothetical protein